MQDKKLCLVHQEHHCATTKYDKGVTITQEEDIRWCKRESLSFYHGHSIHHILVYLSLPNVWELI